MRRGSKGCLQNVVFAWLSKKVDFKHLQLSVLNAGNSKERVTNNLPHGGSLGGVCGQASSHEVHRVLHDTRALLVGQQVEHEGLLSIR